MVDVISSQKFSQIESICLLQKLVLYDEKSAANFESSSSGKRESVL